MEIIIRENKELDSFLCDAILSDYKNGIEDLFIPAGATPEGFYRELQERKAPEWDYLRFYQVDEILNGSKAGEFEKFLNLFLKFRRNQLIKIKEGSVPTGKYSSFLGLGVNGHVAFHEPDLPDHFTSGCVRLGAETLSYLNLEEGTWGITYGLGVFMKSETIYLMVKGKHKLDILRRFLNGDPSLPAVSLKRHKKLRLLVDEETWQILDENL